MSHLQMLQALNPIDLGSVSVALTAVDASYLDDIQSRLERLEPEVFPSTTNMLSRFEDILGLIDAGSDVDRRKAIASKLGSIGGISAPFFVSLAASMGYVIVIVPSPRMFRAGISVVGDPVYSLLGENSPWRWTVHVQDMTGNLSESMLVATFEELKPPFTELNWKFETMLDEGAGLNALAMTAIDEGDGFLAESFPVIDEGDGAKEVYV